MALDLCVFPGCLYQKEKDYWCNKHWGLYPHNCEFSGCEKRPVFNDEPMCFRHSPDEGSSVKGYSAYKKAMGLP